METFTPRQLDQLLASEGGPHVSIFLPVPTILSDAAQDRIRLLNLVGEAQEMLTTHWMPESEAGMFVKPLRELSRDKNLLFGRSDAVAIFLAENVFKTYRLQGPLQEELVVSRTFHLRPLLSEVDRSASYFLLALSKKRVALYSATSQTIEPVTTAGLPSGFEELMQTVTVDRGSQVHSAATDTHGKQGGVFHGHGGKPDTEKSELHDYLSRVENAVSRYLQDQSDAPLVLAGVDYLTSIYRDVTDCRNLIEPSISGNVDHLSPDQLRAQALPIVHAEMERRRQVDAKRIRERDCPTATDPERILCAAIDGQVEMLFFDQEATLYGSFYSETRTLKELQHKPSGNPSDPSHDLVEMAAVETLKHGGAVHAVPASGMPASVKMAAALRF